MVVRGWWMVMGWVSTALWATAAVAVPPATLAPSTVLVDANSGRVLREHDADRAVAPGALNQLMLVLLSVEQAALGAVRLDAPVVVSEAMLTELAPVADVPRPLAGKAVAGRKSPPVRPSEPTGLPRRVPLQAGRSYELGDLLKAVVVSSAPDAAVATANAVGGSRAGCVDLMNARAQKLGMAGTRYASINGEWRGDAGVADVTTARDLARLAQALVSHREVLDWASLNGLPFDDGSSVLRNVNLLLGRIPGVDGLQVASVPGHAASAPRQHVVATAQRGTLRLIAVAVGAASSADRYSAAAELLEWGFETYERVDIVRAGEPLSVPIRIRHGMLSQVTPVAGGSVSLLRRRGEERHVQVRYQLPGVLMAPVARDQAVGELIVEEDGQLVAVVPVLSPSAVGVSGILTAAQ